VITEPFAPKSRREVEALGMADLPLLVLPHPVGQLPREAMRRLAAQSFAEVEFILTAPPEDVAAAYRTRTTARSFPAR
jgi:predicted dienelactone hydrolase